MSLNALNRGEVPVLEIDLLLPIEFMALDPEALQIFCEQDGTADFDKIRFLKLIIPNDLRFRIQLAIISVVLGSLVFVATGNSYVVVSSKLLTPSDYLTSFPYLFVFYFVFVLFFVLLGKIRFLKLIIPNDLRFRIQ